MLPTGAPLPIAQWDVYGPVVVFTLFKLRSFSVICSSSVSVFFFFFWPIRLFPLHSICIQTYMHVWTSRVRSTKAISLSVSGPTLCVESRLPLEVFFEGKSKVMTQCCFLRSVPRQGESPLRASCTNISFLINFVWAVLLPRAAAWVSTTSIRPKRAVIFTVRLQTQKMADFCGHGTVSNWNLSVLFMDHFCFYN